MTKSTAAKDRKEELLVAALLSEPTIERAARRAGISRRTALRWMADPNFDEQYRQAKRELLAHAMGRLRRVSSRAVDELLAVIEDPGASSASRVTASRTVLEMALRSHEDEELELRIQRLERQTFDDEF